jgi:hypothetical protein
MHKNTQITDNMHFRPRWMENIYISVVFKENGSTTTIYFV